MKPASLALAAALAAIVGCVQPVSAQTQDETGAPTINRAAPDRNGKATTGAANSDERARGDEDEISPREATPGRQWNDREPMVMPMRPMMPRRRMMMMGGTGAHFHFVRGKARIDVTCSAQEETEACVRAAGLLIDKIAKLRSAERDDTTTGSADHGDGRPSAGSDEQDAPGERM